MDPPWIEDAEDDMDEDWFFKSIKRYDQLSMYKLSCIPQCICLSPDGSLISVAGLACDDTVELLVFRLPTKILTSCPVQEGLLNRRDFTFRAGIRFQTSEEEKVLKNYFASDGNLILLTSNEISSWAFKEDSDILEKKFSKTSSSYRDFVESRGCLVVHNKSGISRLSSDMSVIEELELNQTVGMTNLCDDDLIVTCEVKQDQIICRETSNLKQITMFTVPIIDMENSVTSFFRHANEMILVCISRKDSTLKVRSLMTKGRELTLENSNLEKASKILYKEDQISAICDNLIVIFQIDWTKFDISFKFCHDAHLARICDFIPHFNVSNLYFSSDVNHGLHAWKINAPN